MEEAVMRDCDVVVVGGGPGGSTTAETLAAAGFEVLVFEAVAVPDAKKYDAGAYRQRCAERNDARAKAAKTAFEGGSVWQYTYQGNTYQRHFSPDGKAHLEIDGNRAAIWNGFTWRIEGDRLIVDKPDGSSEGHYLDSQDRLVLPAGLGTAEKVPLGSRN